LDFDRTGFGKSAKLQIAAARHVRGKNGSAGKVRIHFAVALVISLSLSLSLVFRFQNCFCFVFVFLFYFFSLFLSFSFFSAREEIPRKLRHANDNPAVKDIKFLVKIRALFCPASTPGKNPCSTLPLSLTAYFGIIFL
jgi:hypothetical protein